jgi:hypothetical protein
MTYYWRDIVPTNFRDEKNNLEKKINLLEKNIINTSKFEKNYIDLIKYCNNYTDKHTQKNFSLDSSNYYRIMGLIKYKEDLECNHLYNFINYFLKSIKYNAYKGDGTKIHFGLITELVNKYNSQKGTNYDIDFNKFLELMFEIINFNNIPNINIDQFNNSTYCLSKFILEKLDHNFISQKKLIFIKDDNYSKYITLIRNISDSNKQRKYYLSSLINSIFYKDSKKKFFRDYKLNLQNIDYIKQMCNYSNKSKSNYKMYLETLQTNIDNTIICEKHYSRKKIDNFFSEYYYYLYVKPNIVNAIHQLKEILLEIINFKLKFNEFYPEQYNYFERELIHTITKIKIIMFTKEIKKYKPKMKYNWEIEVYTQLQEKLTNILKLYKINFNTDNLNSKLTIFSSNFAGIFAELFFYYSFREIIFNKDKINKDKLNYINNENIKQLITEIINTDYKLIKLNEPFSFDENTTDADILIDKIVISIKNRDLKASKEDLRRELDIFINNNIEIVYCIFNSLKTNYKTDLQEILTEYNAKLKIIFIDIKILIDAINYLDVGIKELDRFNYDLISLLDY